MISINTPKRFTVIIALLANSLIYCAATSSEVTEPAKPKTALELRLADIRKCSGLEDIKQIKAGISSYNPDLVGRCPALSGFASLLNPVDQCSAREWAIHLGHPVEKTFWEKHISPAGCYKYGTKNVGHCLQSDGARWEYIQRHCQNNFGKK